MVDAYNRTIDYLRVSVTDRCNLRCVYCMPQTGVEWVSHKQILSFEEILRLCSVMAGQGIRRVKVTGGEPLVRKGTVDFIRKLKGIEGIEQVTITSNGVLLEDCLDELIDGGLDALNISLDTLDAETFRLISRGEGLGKVLTVVDRAMSRGLPVKMNCVPIRELNGSELVQIAALARDKNISVRFIELMPIGCGNAFQMMRGDEIRAILEREYGVLAPFSGKLGNGPAVYYTVEGFRGKLGFISSVSHEFCGSCNRLRLTSDGFLKPCLASDTGLDVKALLRGGASDEKIEQAALELIASKPLQHSFSGMQEKTGREQREMFRIGG